MLVLKRKMGESIVINENIEIVVLEQDGDAVRLGIRAPKDIQVHRKEIFEEIKKSNSGAMNSPNLTDLKEQFEKQIKDKI